MNTHSQLTANISPDSIKFVGCMLCTWNIHLIRRLQWQHIAPPQPGNISCYFLMSLIMKRITSGERALPPTCKPLRLSALLSLRGLHPSTLKWSNCEEPHLCLTTQRENHLLMDRSVSSRGCISIPLSLVLINTFTAAWRHVKPNHRLDLPVSTL